VLLPGQIPAQVAGGAKHAHIRAALGQQHDRSPFADAGDGAHPLEDGSKRCSSRGEAGIEFGDGGVE
jgi:hypothetical protein